jgi:hypothetical protein
MSQAMVEVGNADCRWDEFDPELYCMDNYAGVHDEDVFLIDHVCRYFDETLGGVRKRVDAIDVGAGPNLYPSLVMLPYCETVTLFERGQQNRRFLFGQRERYSTMWDPYWDLLMSSPRHNRIEPRAEMRERMRVRDGDIFSPKIPRNQWGLGTMFFVAESITQRELEFQQAVNNFLGMLRPSAPFAAAFMWESKGYRIGSIDFPAVSIQPVDIQHYLEQRVDDLRVASVASETPLREGYKGMILALGRKSRTRS